MVQFLTPKEKDKLIMVVNVRVPYFPKKIGNRTGCCSTGSQFLFVATNFFMVTTIRLSGTSRK